MEAVLQPTAQGERVPEELYALATEYYDDKALATLAIAIGQVNFFVPLALFGRLPPGLPSVGWESRTRVAGH
ncbi:Uncharacterised protein [Mycobacteroides abscessus subsp. abscessus]|nr:Uncharacterised protein [Mycobacteroides abscessus subsp. abscessus]